MDNIITQGTSTADGNMTSPNIYANTQVDAPFALQAKQVATYTKTYTYIMNSPHIEPVSLNVFNVKQYQYQVVGT